MGKNRKIISTLSALVATATILCTNGCKFNTKHDKQTIVQNTNKQQLPDWIPVTESGSLDMASIDRTIQSMKLKENLPLICNYINSVNHGEIGDAAYVEMVNGIAKHDEKLRKDLLTQYDSFKKMAENISKRKDTSRNLLSLSLLLLISTISLSKTKHSVTIKISTISAFFTGVITGCMGAYMGIKYDDNLRISTVEKQIKQAYIQVYKSYSRPISHKISEKDAKRIIQQATMKDLER